MLSLDRLQHLMRSAICGGHEPEFLARVEPDGIQPEARLRIYRHHLTATLTEALEATFPVVCRLVDKRFFAYAAHEYISKTVPSRACLAEYGESFPDFLASFPACANLVYLGDVARLEWAITRSLHAEEARPLDRSALASPDLALRLHPASQLVASQWPIDRIWQANQPGSDTDAIIDLSTGAVRLQVYRRGDRVVIRSVEESTYVFLDVLARGARLIDAAEAARRVSSMFDAAARLSSLFEEGLIARSLGDAHSIKIGRRMA